MSAEDNKGFRSIAEALNQDGVPTPRGPEWARIYNGQWTASTIRAILVNPIYTGDMAWNRRTDARFFKISKGQATERREAYGARLVPNPEEDWVLVRGTHEPLVSRRLFEAAKEARLSRPTSQKQRGARVSGGWKGARSRFLLSGLVWCTRCGGRYEGCRRTKGSKKADGTAVHNFYYGCGSYIRRGKTACRFGPVDQVLLEVAVIEAVCSYYAPLIEGGDRTKLAAAVHEAVGSEGEDIVAARRRAEEELHSIERTVANLLDNLTATNREFVDQRLEVLAKEKSATERRMDELQRVAISRAEIHSMIEEAWTFLQGLRYVLHSGAPAQRIAAVRQCLHRIELEPEEGRASLRLRFVPLPGIGAAVCAGLDLAGTAPS
jgi:site-specific DNA recombinase